MKSTSSARDRGAKLAAADKAAAAGDWANATATYSELVDFDPRPPGWLLERLANSERQMGAYPNALRTLERAYGTFVAEEDYVAAVRVTTRITGMRMMFGDWSGARPGRSGAGATSRPSVPASNAASTLSRWWAATCTIRGSF